MALAKDIRSDNDGDLYIDPLTGDFKIDFSDEQHIRDIIESFKGCWKESPNVGVGIKQYQNSAGKDQEIEREIKLQLQADGYNTNNVRVETTVDGINIFPNAERI